MNDKPQPRRRRRRPAAEIPYEEQPKSETPKQPRRRTRKQFIDGMDKKQLRGTPYDPNETGPIKADWLACGQNTRERHPWPLCGYPPLGYVVPEGGKKLAYRRVSNTERRYLGTYTGFKQAYAAICKPEPRKRTRSAPGAKKAG